MENATPIAEAWNVHVRGQFYVLDSIPAESLTATSAIKGRIVGEMFAHIHNIRLTWLEVSGPQFMNGLTKLGKDEASNKERIRGALEASGQAIANMIQAAEQAGGKLKNYKRGAAVFFGYIVSHESYHMGEIGIVLNQSGHKLDQKVAYGMWEWSKL